MKPAWSLTSTGSLPQAAANPRAASTVASAAVMGRTTSTRDMAGAGLKKWMPQTRSGRSVAIAISTTGSVEVLVASSVSGLQMLSSSAKRSFLTVRSSTTDSMTRSTSTSSPRWVVARTRPRTASASAWVRFSLATCLPSERSSAATMASAPDWLRLRRITSMPEAAATSAMPEPMIPEPTIPTRLIDMGGQLTGR